MRLTMLIGIAIAFASPLLASDAVTGKESTFQSPNGLTERCVQISPIPGGNYSDGDVKDEAEFCLIDLYAADVALCPKTWSTSPGMMIYDISSGNDRSFGYQTLVYLSSMTAMRTNLPQASAIDFAFPLATH